MKIITTARGNHIKVDDDDHEWLEMITWHVNEYAKSHFGMGRLSMKLYMHKLIMRVHCTSVMVDHIDGDKLNNQKSNLRVATRKQNGANRKPSGSSKFLGVSWHRPTRKWVVYIIVNGKNKYLGLFNKEEDAAKAYDLEAVSIHGQFANLNFKP